MSRTILAALFLLACGSGSVGHGDGSFAGVGGASANAGAQPGGGASTNGSQPRGGSANVSGSPGAPEGGGASANGAPVGGGGSGYAGAQQAGATNTDRGGSPGRGGAGGSGSAGTSGGRPSGESGAGSGGSPPTASGGAASGASYSTSFDLKENPLSEKGVWVTGTDEFQTPVRTANGLAFGTQSGDEWATGKTYNDSDAYLTGFANQHRVDATIHRSGTPNGDLEIEVLLGWRVGPLRTTGPGPTHSDGIEVAIGIGQFGQFLYVSRFFPESKVAAADFSSALSNAVGDVKDGDIFSAELTLNPNAKPSPTGTVRVSIKRGSKSYDLGTVTDATLYQIGQPGIGFFRQTKDNVPDDPQMYCWSSFTATSL